MADRLGPDQHPLFLVLALDTLAADLGRNQWKRLLIDYIDSYSSTIMLHADRRSPSVERAYVDYRAKVGALEIDAETRAQLAAPDDAGPDAEFLALARPYIPRPDWAPDWSANYADAPAQREHFVAVRNDVEALTRALAAEHVDILRKVADGAALVAGAQ